MMSIGIIMRITVLILLSTVSMVAVSGKQEAIKLLENGQYHEAMKEFTALAKTGDHVAMVAIGNMHYRGHGTSQDYKKALDWWMKAYELGNPDAIVNIGVLFRDGKGVEKNLMIAYDIFLLIQLKNIGGPEIQYRTNSNIVKTVSRMSKLELEEALCYSEEYIARYINSYGQGTVVQYKDETSLKEKITSAGAMEIPKYDCTKFQTSTGPSTDS